MPDLDTFRWNLAWDCGSLLTVLLILLLTLLVSYKTAVLYMLGLTLGSVLWTIGKFIYQTEKAGRT